jgi:hypothetical protein
MSGNFARPKTLVGAAVLRYKVLSFQEILTFTDDFSGQVWASTCKSLPGWSV